jgi:hypothetical protein
MKKNKCLLPEEPHQNTVLLYQCDGKCSEDKIKLHGLGFSTEINGKEYRGAVRVPQNIDHEILYKMFKMLAGMLAHPTNPVCRCVDGNEMLFGKECTLDDFDNFVREGIIAE